MPTVYIKTFGCQMNKRDSEVLLGNFLNEGFVLVDNYEQADIVLVNTCAVRKHAEDRVFSLLGALGKRKMLTGQPKLIAMVGCMAEEWKEKAFSRAPYLDIVCGANSLPRLVDVLKKMENDSLSKQKEEKILLVKDGQREENFYQCGGWFTNEKNHAYINIMEGCDNFCSYCIVPYVRGRERSRDYHSILEEVKKLISQGISQFTLLGQNVNSYRGGISFPDLLEKIASLQGVQLLSFATSHPKDTSEKLFQVIAKYKNISKYLHLPLQSGSDRILQLMNRNYTYNHYKRIIELFRKIVPEGQVGTDIIVGFPTETDEDYKLTYQAIEQIKFSCAYIFKYSVRPGTQAAEFPDDVPMKVKEERHAKLLALQKNIVNRNKNKT